MRDLSSHFFMNCIPSVCMCALYKRNIVPLYILYSLVLLYVKMKCDNVTSSHDTHPCMSPYTGYDSEPQHTVIRP